MITISATIKKNDGTFITIDKKNLLSIETSIFERQNISNPSWGIISNSGNVKFIDIDGSIKTLANNQQLKIGMPLEIFLKNTITDYSQSVGSFFTKSWNYDDATKEVNLSFSDELLSWQENIINSINYDTSQSSLSQYLNGEEIYNRILYEMQRTGYDINKFDEIDEETRNRLKLFKMPFFYIEAQSWWRVWTYFCYALQLHIYLNNNGKIVVKYNGGN